jgi:formylglycine-generating enzyme required for sulfatase activity
MKRITTSACLLFAALMSPRFASAQADCTAAYSIDALRDVISNAAEPRVRELVQKCGLAFQWNASIDNFFSRLQLAPETLAAFRTARAPQVDTALVEVTFWNSIKDDKEASSFQLYVQKYPQGQFVDIAKLRVQQLSRPAAPPPPDPAIEAAKIAGFVTAIDASLRVLDLAAAEKVLADLTKAFPGADVRASRTKIDDLRRRIDEGRSRAAATVAIHPLDQQNYVWIPAGAFQMGCSTGDRDCGASENPQHPVRLSNGYWLGQTEVSVGAYRRFVSATSRRNPVPGTVVPNMPVNNVSWTDAQDFCSWVGGNLPTEAEWEYAARAGSIGARHGELKEISWYKDNASQRLHEVGQKKSNAWGVQDMLGNLWEWTRDDYAADSYRPASIADPTGPATGRDRVVRGGSWENDTGLLRASLRFGNNPDAGSLTNGFRCALKVLP